MSFSFPFMSLFVSGKLSSAHVAWTVAWQHTVQPAKKKKIQLMGGLCRLFHTCSAFSPSTLFVIHLYRGRQVPLKHHILFRGSSPSEPNEHVEIQWILICCYIGTRDKSAREDLLGEIEKKGPRFSISRAFPVKQPRKGRWGKKQLTLGTAIFFFLTDGEVLKAET